MTKIHVTSARGYLASSLLAVIETSFSIIFPDAQAIETGVHPKTEGFPAGPPAAWLQGTVHFALRVNASLAFGTEARSWPCA